MASVAVFMHHGELAETTVSCLDTENAAIPKALRMQIQRSRVGTGMEQHSSVTFGSTQAMLISLLSIGHGDWSVGSPAGVLVAPGPGADRSPAAGFMSGLNPSPETASPINNPANFVSMREPQRPLLSLEPARDS
jgi:hypothetical protein